MKKKMDRVDQDEILTAAQPTQPLSCVLSVRSTLYSQLSGSRFNIKTVFPRYGDSHVKDKTVERPSYLLHEDPYTG